MAAQHWRNQPKTHLKSFPVTREGQIRSITNHVRFSHFTFHTRLERPEKVCFMSNLKKINTCYYSLLRIRAREV